MENHWNLEESFMEKSLIFKSDAELNVIQIQSSAVMMQSNLSQYHMRDCDNSGRKWIGY